MYLNLNEAKNSRTKIGKKNSESKHFPNTLFRWRVDLLDNRFQANGMRMMRMRFG